MYFINASLGTPPQPATFQIDTGSSAFIVYSSDAVGWCTDPTSDPPCSELGTYNPNASSTSTFLNDGLLSQYGGGQYDIGLYYTDNVKIGSATINDVQLGVSFNGTEFTNIMGVGVGHFNLQRAMPPFLTSRQYPDNEPLTQIQNTTYPTVIQLMAEQGIIASSAYSLYLNGKGSPAGSVLFGGVDTAKYEGELYTLPVLPEERAGVTQIYEFTVALYSISYSVGGKNNTAASYPDGTLTLLDSGTTAAFLPLDALQSLGQAFNIDSNGNIDCSALNSPDSITFTFENNAAITVPIGSFVSQSREGCSISLTEMGDGEPAILGDVFMRYSYAVFDVDNDEVHIAQSVINATSSNILEIGSGSGAVPNGTEPTGGNSTGATPTTSSGSKATGSGSATPTGSTTSPSSTSGQSSTRATQSFTSVAGLLAAGILFTFAL